MSQNSSASNSKADTPFRSFGEAYTNIVNISVRDGLRLPVIDIYEHDPSRYRAPFYINVDLEKVDFDDEFELSYVDYILLCALNGETKIDVHRHYTFGDTPNWWGFLTATLDELHGREIISIEVCTT